MDRKLTLNDIVEQTNKFLVQSVVNDLIKPNPLLEMLTHNQPIPTRWQKMHNRLKNYRTRIVGAWNVLRGKKEAIDPFDYY